MPNISKEKWNLIDEHFEYIYRNLDICCQDLCEGQDSKCKLEEVMELLVDIKQTYDTSRST